MTHALLYWILMLLWLVLGLWTNWPVTKATAQNNSGQFILFILLALLGWSIYGSPLHK